MRCKARIVAGPSMNGITMSVKTTEISLFLWAVDREGLRAVVGGQNLVPKRFQSAPSGKSVCSAPAPIASGVSIAER